MLFLPFHKENNMQPKHNVLKMTVFSVAFLIASLAGTAQSAGAQGYGCPYGSTQYVGTGGVTYEATMGNDVWTYWVQLTWCVDSQAIISNPQAVQWVQYHSFVSVWSLAPEPHYSLITIDYDRWYTYVYMTGEMKACIDLLIDSFCTYEYPTVEIFGYWEGSYIVYV